MTGVGRAAAFTQGGAISAMQSKLGMPAGWTTAIANFSGHDSAANNPRGPTDTATALTMRIELTAPGSVAAGEEIVLRVTLFNDAYEPAEVWRNQLVGPTAETGPGGLAIPAVEATYGQEEEALVRQPFTFYGRERRAGGFAPGRVTITASYQPRAGERMSASTDIVVT